ncbi:urea transporter [Tabrizicola sp.]|uniref:urea transporter n=1 Tax=Tabrizicola sp. TaxID=2005166 RepID=UPI0035B28F2C
MKDLRLSATGLEVDHDGAPLQAFADTVLRGLGQVMLQNNSYAGLLFLAGIACNSPVFAGAALLGTLASTLAAIALEADRQMLRQGMFGFNGGLVGIALLCFLQPTPLAWACVALAAAGSTLVLAALQNALAAARLPVLTAPFVLTSLCVLLASTRFGRLQASDLLPTPGLPNGASLEGVATASTLGEGLLTGVGQVFLQDNMLTGALFILGLFVASRRACLAALAGSLSGMLVAWAMGAAEPAIRSGLFGYNSVLVAIALSGAALAPGRIAIACGLFATLATPFVTAASAAALEPLGLPALTLPFVLVTWTALLASRFSTS